MTPPCTLEAAREFLLGRRSPVVAALDRLLGLGILAAGPFGLIAGQPWLLIAWGWLDQKNELVLRLDEAVATGRHKLGKVSGTRRHETLAATHTMLVVACFFTALREEAGHGSADAELSGSEQDRLLMAEDAEPAEFRDLVQRLARQDVPLPWAGAGFETNVRQLHGYFEELARRTLRHLDRLDGWSRSHAPDEGPRPLVDAIVQRAADRYRAEYRALAAEVPEYAIWASQGEHAAAHRSLERLEELVKTLGRQVRNRQDTAYDAVVALNRSKLTQPLLDRDETAQLQTARTPSVADGYVEPRFRWAVMDGNARPAQERWWSYQPEGTDLGAFMAMHVTSPRGSSLPLLILGHPGSGKSLFTKVCAARLSASPAFTTVRMKLRNVTDPAASVYHQLDDYLREWTHGRADWNRLCEHSDKLTRVVLIDGLDELMQATGATESHYLRRVADFQRDATTTGGPVAVVVTSRTVVADLARIPHGCVVVKLEDFTDEQVDLWAANWERANTAGIAEGRVQPVSGKRLLCYGELARQPLLLALLTLVLSQGDLPLQESSADLYRTLLDDFTRREISRPDNHFGSLPDDQRHEAEQWLLGVVAFGMVNRDRQHLHEEDLAIDLHALPGPEAAPVPPRRDDARAMALVSRVVARFFFVNVNEADSGASGRSYEFLHATFADYLIAHHTVALLRDAALARRLRTASQQWDDDLLFALLSHRTLGVKGSLVLDFVTEILREGEEVATVLEHISATAHSRWDRGRHGGYDPSGRTAAERAGTYLMNIVSLRLAATADPVTLRRLCPAGSEPLTWWRRQLAVWEAVLPETEMQAFLSRTMAAKGSDPAVYRGTYVTGYYEDVREMLAFDTTGAFRTAAGRALVWRGDHHSDPGRRVERHYAVAVAALTATLRRGAGGPEALERFRAVRQPLIRSLALLKAAVAARCAGDLEQELVRDVIEECVEAGAEVPTTDLAALLVAHPPLMREMHGLFQGEDPEGVAIIMIKLGRLLDASAMGLSPASDELARTAEGQAVLAMTPELARKCIPALALSLARRHRGTSPYREARADAAEEAWADAAETALDRPSQRRRTRSLAGPSPAVEAEAGVDEGGVGE